jgi:hypothetical protein
VFIVRLEVIAALLADRAWNQRLNAVKSTREARQVIADFCKAKGLEVAEVPLK